MSDNKKQTAHMNTILSINFMDIRIPKVKYLVFIDGSLYKIASIDTVNNSVLISGVFSNDETYYKLSELKDKFIKLVSVHSKITHSIQHTCINNVLKLIKAYANAANTSPDDVIYNIINNKLQLPLIGKVVPCYIFPSEGDKINFISANIITNFELKTNALKLGVIELIQRSNKNTTYTIKTDIVDIMCDRSDFKLIGKKDRKDLFYVL